MYRNNGARPNLEAKDHDGKDEELAPTQPVADSSQESLDEALDIIESIRRKRKAVELKEKIEPPAKKPKIDFESPVIVIFKGDAVTHIRNLTFVCK